MYMIQTYPVAKAAGTPEDRHFHVVLVEPEIPPNTGTIARLCAGTNTHLHLVRPLAFELDDTKLKRAGLDYWPNVYLTVHDSWDEIVRIFRPDQMHLFTTKASRCFTDVSYKLGDALIFGPETRGLAEHVRTRFESECVTIPIRKDHIRSLNLATSVSIGLYEGLRQVGFGPVILSGDV